MTRTGIWFYNFQAHNLNVITNFGGYFVPKIGNYSIVDIICGTK